MGLAALRHLSLVLLVALLAGCESLPHDGPSARSVAEMAGGPGGYQIVELDHRVSQVLVAHPHRPMRALATVASTSPIDLIGVGDVLLVSVLQPDSSAAEARAFTLSVDRNGTITVPFAAPVLVQGKTSTEAATAIRSALRGRLVNPQVVVSVTSNLTNTVTVIGEVRNVGRYPLLVGGDRLLDLLAAAGGSTRPAADVVVTVVRDEKAVSTTLSALLAEPSENVRLAPGDQVRVAYRPRKFSTFGAFTRSAQIPIEDDTVSLAGAISRMGGLDTNAAQASSVLVFRLERPEVARELGLSAPEGQASVPVIYRLNLREPSGFFVAGAFQIQADDLIYAPRAETAELRKFFELVSAISRVAYDVSVTRVIQQ
jgi:polysaccharide export outer membrane protein